MSMTKREMNYFLDEELTLALEQDEYRAYEQDMQRFQEEQKNAEMFRPTLEQLRVTTDTIAEFLSQHRHKLEQLNGFHMALNRVQSAQDFLFDLQYPSDQIR